MVTMQWVDIGKANHFSTAFFISSYSKSQAHTTTHTGWVNVGLNPVWGFLSPLEAGRLLLKIQMLTAVSNYKRFKTPSCQSKEVPGPTDPFRTDKYFNKKSTWGDRLRDWMWLFPTFGDLVVLLLLYGWLLFFDWSLFSPYLHPRSQASETPPTLPADQNSPQASKLQDRLPLQRCSSPVVYQSCGTPQTCRHVLPRTTVGEHSQASESNGLQHFPEMSVLSCPMPSRVVNPKLTSRQLLFVPLIVCSPCY